MGRIVRGDPVKDFEGYRNKEATRKKILTDVLASGDRFFRSGDILVMDELGFVYFQDRSGDTFRWKGENVSTQEVESMVMESLGEVAVCYGVLVPGCGGRAGMVAVPGKTEEEVDLRALRAGVEARLPPYARPIFVRIAKEMQMTGEVIMY